MKQVALMFSEVDPQTEIVGDRARWHREIGEVPPTVAETSSGGVLYD
jgi:hypothetical protein